MDRSLTIDGPLEGVRVLDAAKGIVVALRGCTLREAFVEILAVAEEYNTGPLAICQALVEFAEARPQNQPSAAHDAVSAAWASLLPRRRL